MKEKIAYLKGVFDRFLKDNNCYDAWYERYRLDNLMYDDEVPIEKFLKVYTQKPKYISGIFYDGIEATCMTTTEGDKFIAEHKRCDILSNGTMSDIDSKWIDSCKHLINY